MVSKNKQVGAHSLFAIFIIYYTRRATSHLLSLHLKFKFTREIINLQNEAKMQVRFSNINPFNVQPNFASHHLFFAVFGFTSKN